MNEQDPQRREPIVPPGCIAAIPQQSVRTCEQVIELLATELRLVNRLFGEVVHGCVHDKHASPEVLQECVLWQVWNSTCAFQRSRTPVSR
jgi:hypothetical protein